MILMTTTKTAPALTPAQVKRRDALEAVCRYGNHTIERKGGLWTGYQALAREGKISIARHSGGYWAHLQGDLRRAFLDGEDMTQYASGSIS